MKRFLAALLFLLPFSAAALEVPAAPANAILDQAEMLSETFEVELAETLLALEEETSAEIGVLTVGTLEGQDIEGYALDVFRTWGIGQEVSNNGLLLLIALEDREMRIEVGYGLEGRVTDADASAIIRHVLTPNFQAGAYEEGVAAAIDVLAQEVRAEADEYGFAEQMASQGSSSYASESDRAVSIAIVIFFTAFFQFMVYSGMGKKLRKKYQRVPVVLGIALLVLVFMEGIGPVVWAFDGAMALAVSWGLRKIDYDKLSKGKGGRRGNDNDWFGGGFSGGSSGGFSGGGFSGGSSGGGGSSGSW